MSGEAALADFLDRAVNRLPQTPPRPSDPTANPRGDHDLNPHARGIEPVRQPRLAAVLVPVVPRETGLSILFTVRAAHLRDHSGQIAFPGGKIEPDDATPAEAALREAEEEIGIGRNAVRPLGYLDPYLSATGFLVMPVVGLVDPLVRLRLAAAEVSEAFEVPLQHLLDLEHRRIGVGTWQGWVRRYYAISFGERLIWGVTAGIVTNLHERLYP